MIPAIKTVTLAVSVEARVPTVPNYIKVGSEFRDISTFKPSELVAISMTWAQELLHRAAERKKNHEKRIKV